jgi:hypothetical protein
VKPAQTHLLKIARLVPLMAALTPAAAVADPMAIFINLNYADGNYCSKEDRAQGCVPKAGELESLGRNAARLGVRKENMIVIPPLAWAADRARIEWQANNIRFALHALNPALGREALRQIINDIKQIGPDGLKDPVVLQKLKDGARNKRMTGILDALGAKSLSKLQRDSLGFANRERNAGTVEEQVRAALKKAREQKGSIEMLSISGHSIGNEIFGESGLGISQSGMRDLIRDYPEFVKNPRRIALPGCYTYTKQEFDRWQTDLGARPDSLIVGWDGKGRTRNDSLEWKYLNQTFDYADSLDKRLSAPRPDKLSEATIRKGFLALKSVNASRNAAISYCGHYFNHSPTGEEIESCDEQWDTLYERATDIEHQFIANDRVPESEPPEDGPKSPLRRFYNDLQKMCPMPNYPGLDAEDKAETKKTWTDYRDRTVRTIFWTGVRANFVRCRAGDLETLRTSLKTAGLPDLVIDQGRREFMRSYLDLSEKTKKRADTAGKAAAAALDKISPLAELDNKIPLPWIENTSPACQ